MICIHEVADLLRKGSVIDCSLFAHCIYFIISGVINIEALLIRVTEVMDAQVNVMLAWLEFGTGWFSGGSNGT